MDVYRKVTTKIWFSRLLESVVGVLLGIALIPGSIGLLGWNEGRSVKTYKSYAEGARVVVSVPADAIDPANEGKLVHLSGFADTDETLSDDDFGVQVRALRLKRDAEMYQWTEREETETREKLGGSEETITTYYYEKKWRDELIDHQRFEKPQGHENPRRMPFQSALHDAQTIMVGAFKLSTRLTGEIGHFTPFAVPAELELKQKKARLNEGGIYIGDNPASPQIGDQRIFFSICKPGDVSLVAAQTGNSFMPYQTEAGRTLERLYSGRVGKVEFFVRLQRENTILTWLLRGAGVLAMFIGFSLIMQPLRVLAGVIPLLGNVVGMGIGVASFLLALTVSAFTIAISWIVFRPLLGILLLALCVVLSYVLFSKIGVKEQRAV